MQRPSASAYLLEPRQNAVGVEEVRAWQLVYFFIDREVVLAHGALGASVHITLRDRELWQRIHHFFRCWRCSMLSFDMMKQVLALALVGHDSSNKCSYPVGVVLHQLVDHVRHIAKRVVARVAGEHGRRQPEDTAQSVQQTTPVAIAIAHKHLDRGAAEGSAASAAHAPREKLQQAVESK